MRHDLRTSFVNDSPSVMDMPVEVLAIPPRAQRALRSAGCTKVGDLLHLDQDQLLQIHGIGPVAVSRLGKIVAEARFSKWTKNSKEPARFVDDEINVLLRTVPKERNREIVAARLGWNGERGVSLAEIGERIGITRERVRQICDRTTARWSGIRLHRVAEAVEMLHSLAP